MFSSLAGYNRGWENPVGIWDFSRPAKIGAGQQTGTARNGIPDAAYSIYY